MPEDTYSELLNSVAGGAKDTPPAATPPAAPNTDPAPQKEPDPAPQKEPDVDPNKAPVPPKEPQKDEPPAPAKTDPTNKTPDANAKFAQMRVENAKLQKAIKSAAEAEGLTVDEYLEKMETGALKKRAETMQVPPEVLRRLEETEAALQLAQQEKIRDRLEAQFTRVQTTFKLSDADLDSFVRTLGEQGFNFQNPNVDYEMLYRGMNHDKLLEAARQEWIIHSQQASAAPKGATVNGKSSGDGGLRRVDTPEDLQMMLAEALAKK